MKRLAVLAAAGLVGVLVVLTGGWALAGSGGGDGVQACYHNNSGALRVDVSGSGCRRNETPVALGTSLITRRVVASSALPSPGVTGVAAECAAGEVVLGGGLVVESINPEKGLLTNAPLPLVDCRLVWPLALHSAASAATPVTLRAYAICAPVVSAP